MIHDQIIRVFPRRTKWTPTSRYAFVGDPPIWVHMFSENAQVMVSCTFTWDKPEAERLQRAWKVYYPSTQIGGPAYDDKGGEFVPGRFVKDGIVFTSRGCIRSCSFCFVPQREGKLRELPITEGWNVADNNLLACSQRHITRVFKMLRRQTQPIEFSGGLDARLFNELHKDLLESIRLKFAFFACDSIDDLKNLERVGKLLNGMSIEKKRCYVLIGYDAKESINDAEARLRRVYELGFLPFAMLYRPKEKELNWSQDWKDLQRKWTRPAIYKAIMK